MVLMPIEAEMIETTNLEVGNYTFLSVGPSITVGSLRLGPVSEPSSDFPKRLS